MAFPKKTQLPIAQHNRSDFDLSSRHTTTSNFLEFSVSKCMELVPNQSINIEHACFSRLDPMDKPTFGGASIQHRAFFVPMRTIFPAWNNFITDTPIHKGATDTTPVIPNTVPYIKNKDLVELFINGDDRFSELLGGTSDLYPQSDFVYSTYRMNSQGVYESDYVEYYKFTKKGKFAYKLLRSLGYGIIFTDNNSDTYSAMPLLAAARIYYDYYYPSQYFNDADSSFLESLFDKNVNQLNTMLTVALLRRIFNILSNVPYPSDYFTSAWDTSAGPNSGHFSSVTITDPTAPNEITNSVYSNSEAFEATPVITSNGISQFAINALKALSDYLKRHQIVGSKALDRYLSRFGVKLPDAKINRSMLLKEYAQQLEFGDVTSTAATELATLGDYAGKGISFGDNGINFSTDEYGYLFIVTTIAPYVEYYQGIDRKVMHLSRFDFHTPEFDNLGTQPIGCKELYIPIDTVNYPADYQSKIFGFVPRYAEYKIPISQLTGDLALNSQKTSNEPWTLFRDMSIIYDRPDGNGTIFNDIVHNRDFVLATDKAQYNRIFQHTDDNYDHFKLAHNFKINTSFPGKSLYNDYNFEDEDKSKKVTVDVGGSNVMN